MTTRFKHRKTSVICASGRAAVFARACGILLVCTVLGVPEKVLAQSILADGSTATGVTIDQSGAFIVTLAPADTAQISHNAYSAFSVPPPGVSFDNSGANAALIINEVTSTAPTQIDGPVTITGRQADLIISNPNGIAVNGGRFETTGNVALTTGQISRSGVSGVTSSVTGGEIAIGSDGLSGTMQELALISQSLRVSGELGFDAGLSDGHVNLIIGAGSVSFDRERGGFGQNGNGLLPWALRTKGVSTNTDALVVDITRSGSIRAGRISMTVTDQGAGVRIAGDQLAGAGGFRLNASGQLSVSGGIESEGSVNIGAGTVAFESDGGVQPSVGSTQSGVTIVANAAGISLASARIAGRIASSDNLASVGGVTLSAMGDVTATGSGTQRAALVSDAEGLPNLQNLSSVAINADGDVQLSGLDIQTTDDVRITANGDIALSHATGEVGRTALIFAGANLNFDAVRMSADTDVRLTGQQLRFGNKNANQARTEVLSHEGALALRSTDGDIINNGSLLEGNQTSTSDATSRGGVTVRASGDVINRSLSVDRLGVMFGRVDGLFVDASGDVRNETGRLFSNADISITAGGDLVNATALTGAQSPLRISRERGDRYASALYLRRSNDTRIDADYGDRAIAGEQSFILGVGDVTLSARDIYNLGADITGANVSIDAIQEVQNTTLQTGAFSMLRACRWVCTTSGKNTLGSVTATMNASQTLNVTAGNTIQNTAGNVTATTGMVLTAPLVRSVSLPTPLLIEQPAGLTGFFRNQRSLLLADQIDGSLRNLAGPITIDGDLIWSLGAQQGSSIVEVTGSEARTATPVFPLFFDRRPIGLLWNIFD